MSSARNHAKRSHRSEARKADAFNASARRAYYSPANVKKREVGILQRMLAVAKRRNRAQDGGSRKAGAVNDNV